MTAGAEIRLGVVGARGLGRGHIRCAGAIDRVRVVAVADQDQAWVRADQAGSKLIQVGLAEEGRPGRLQPGDDGGRLGWDIGEVGTPCRRRHAGNVDVEPKATVLGR